MDGTRGIYRRALWLPCVLCAVFGLSTVQAATRQYVPMPSAASAANSSTGQASKVGSELSILDDLLNRPYIKGGGSGSGTPVNGIKAAINFSLPKMYGHLKSGIKGGVIGVGASTALSYLINEIGAFIDENGVPMKNGKKSVPASGLYWCHVNSDTHCNNSAPDRMRLSTPTQFPDIYKPWNPNSQLCSVTYSMQNNGSQVLISYVFNNPGQCGVRDGTSQITYYRRGTCPAPSFFDAELMSCVENAPVPLDDPDYDSMFNIANSQNASWLRGLLRQSCNGSLNPGACFQQLFNSSALSGPSTVKGPSSTTTTNTTTAAGVASQTTTTTNTNYHLNYGGNYFDYRKTTQIITQTDGVTTSDTTIDEPTDIEQEDTPPEDEKQEEPVSCSGQGCDGPEYEDQYTPLEETKENYLDDYASRVAAIPIIQAVGGLFEVNVNGSCPVWTFNHQMQVLGASMPINLVFDYLCLPWFVQYGPWIRAVIYLVAVYAAIRIALL